MIVVNVRVVSIQTERWKEKSTMWWKHFPAITEESQWSEKTQEPIVRTVVPTKKPNAKPRFWSKSTNEVCQQFKKKERKPREGFPHWSLSREPISGRGFVWYTRLYVYYRTTQPKERQKSVMAIHRRIRSGICRHALSHAGLLLKVSYWLNDILRLKGMRHFLSFNWNCASSSR